MGTINHDKENRCIEFTPYDILNHNVPQYTEYRAQGGRRNDILGKVTEDYGIEPTRYYDIVVKAGYYQGMSVDFTEKPSEDIESVDRLVSTKMHFGQDIDVWSKEFLNEIADEYKVDVLPLLEASQRVPKPEEGSEEYYEAVDTVIEYLDDYLSEQEKVKINGWIDNIRDAHGVAEINPGWCTTTIVERTNPIREYYLITAYFNDKDIVLDSTRDLYDEALEQLQEAYQIDRDGNNTYDNIPEDVRFERYMVYLSEEEYMQISKDMTWEEHLDYLRAESESYYASYPNMSERHEEFEAEMEALPMNIEIEGGETLIVNIDADTLRMTARTGSGTVRYIEDADIKLSVEENVAKLAERISAEVSEGNSISPTPRR